MYFTDDLRNPKKWQIPVKDSTTLVPPKGYLIYWFDKQPKQGALHVNIKLSF
ncbi:MAG: lamin tail domain-containing protein, partial [Bacteroidia bacterium]|nr:lamin tail domain-containing protein [Bacteroidia bacterium]